jgi:hypothetical protein
MLFRYTIILKRANNALLDVIFSTSTAQKMRCSDIVVYR